MHFIFDWEKKIISIKDFWKYGILKLKFTHEIDFDDFEGMLEDWLEFMGYKKEI